MDTLHESTKAMKFATKRLQKRSNDYHKPNRRKGKKPLNDFYESAHVFMDIKSLTLNPHFIPNISETAVRYLNLVLCESMSFEINLSIQFEGIFMTAGILKLPSQKLL